MERPKFFQSKARPRGGGEGGLKRGEASLNRAIGRAERNLAKRNKMGHYETEPDGIRAAERGR